MKIKGIHIVKRKLANGQTRIHYYAWRGGPKMKSAPGTEPFGAEHARFKQEASKAVVDTIETLIDRFTGPEDDRNPDFLALAESTRADHLYAFGIIKKKWPRLAIKLTQMKGMKADIRKWHRSYAANPRKADKLLFSLSKVFSYAVADELIEKNPCTGIERLYEGSRKESIWSPEQIATARTGLHKSLLRPFEIAYGTGQRQGDVLSRSPKDWDGTYLQFLQSKGKKKLKVRAHADLKADLDSAPKDAMRLCLNSRGRPWTKDGFKTSWFRACKKLGIVDVTFHDLRGTFICERAREGSSIEDISRISGHSMSEIKSVLEKHYLATDQGLSDAVILRMGKNP